MHLLPRLRGRLERALQRVKLVGHERSHLGQRCTRGAAHARAQGARLLAGCIHARSQPVQRSAAERWSERQRGAVARLSLCAAVRSPGQHDKPRTLQKRQPCAAQRPHLPSCDSRTACLRSRLCRRSSSSRRAAWGRAGARGGVRQRRSSQQGARVAAGAAGSGRAALPSKVPGWPRVRRGRTSRSRSRADSWLVTLPSAARKLLSSVATSGSCRGRRRGGSRGGRPRAAGARCPGKRVCRRRHLAPVGGLCVCTPVLPRRAVSLLQLLRERGRVAFIDCISGVLMRAA